MLKYLKWNYVWFHDLQGSRGDSGEMGPPGERGEKGEMGLSGPSVSRDRNKLFFFSKKVSNGEK